MLNKAAFLQKLREVSPIRLIVGSFLAIILVGALLLILPFSSRDGGFTSPLDAFFTATSATCVTGLVVFDTWSKWSAFGQAVILMMIQLGGLGLLSFTTGFTLLLRRKLGLRDLQLAKEYTSGNVMDAPRLIRTILAWTFGCEAAGALLLMCRFVPEFGGYGVWVAVFTSVSAYCNAGFDILGFKGPFVNLIPYAKDPLVSLTVAFLIIIGGIGFLVVSDIHICYLRKKREGERHPRLTLHSKIVLWMTGILLAVGTILFFVMEYGGVLRGMNFFEKLNVSFFQSAAARTAGFATVDIASMHDITKLMSVILMFIGASPSSTGGGIKTTTFVVLAATVWSVLRGHEDTVVFKRRIEKQAIYKSLAIVAVGLLLVLLTTTVILLAEGDGVSAIDALYEATSAFGTVGLSAGLTPELSVFSKLALSFTMFVGRVGPVSLAFAVSMRHSGRGGTILPEGKVIVG